MRASGVKSRSIPRGKAQESQWSRIKAGSLGLFHNQRLYHQIFHIFDYESSICRPQVIKSYRSQSIRRARCRWVRRCRRRRRAPAPSPARRTAASGAGTVCESNERKVPEHGEAWVLTDIYNVPYSFQNVRIDSLNDECLV